MKRIKKYTLIILSLLMLLSLAGCNMIERTPESIAKTVLAKVGDDEITRGDVDKYLASTLSYLEKEYGKDFEEEDELKETLKSYRKQAIEALIEEKILLDKKDEIGVEYSEEELNKEVEEGLNSVKEYCTTDDVLDEKKLKEYFESAGFKDEEEYKSEYKQNLIISKIKEKLQEGVEVSDKEIEEYYNQNISSYKVAPGGDVTHLLFSATEKDGEEAINKAKADCEAARELVLQGKTFQDIQDMYGDEDYCVTQELGHIDYGATNYDEKFVKALDGLESDKVSEPVQTSFGYHLIVITNINKEEQTQTLDQAKESINETLLNSKKTKAYDKAIKKYKKELDCKTYEDRL